MRNTTAARWVGFALLGSSLAACATKSDFRNLESEVRALAARQDTATMTLRRVERVNRAVIDSVGALSESVFEFRGDVSNRLLAIQDQLLLLGELVGQSQRSLANMREELIAQRQQLEERLRARDAPGDTLELAGGEVGDQEVVGGGDADDVAFASLEQALDRGNLSTARRGFERFISMYPNSEFAPSAHLHLGELLSGEERLEEAVAIYLEVPRLFPTAEEVPDALYRAGVLSIELNDFEQARQLLERLVNTYPGHRYVEQAQERLEGIP
ncbi:MAG: tetratricopeptide repeat protein [Gemmatimonadota bacterium]|nr:tetratricopeptide repeat protein [Gemmatimonadota bacterium]